MTTFSLNANGLQLSSKRRAIFKIARDARPDVAFLQETHCADKLEKIWAAEWGGDVYFSNGRTNARGVATLIKRGSDITVLDSFKDDAGDYWSFTSRRIPNAFCWSMYMHPRRTTQVTRFN